MLTAGKMIEKFIETSSQFLVPTTGKDSSIPVCALVVRCLEVSFKYDVCLLVIQCTYVQKYQIVVYCLLGQVLQNICGYC